jgi:hypothetical protein
MGTLEQYRRIIETVLSEHAAIPYAYGDIRSEAVFDRERDRYLLVDVGWDRGRRVHGILVHIDIIGDKVWVQRDGTEDGVAIELTEAGIPKDRIVLGFHAPELRPHTGFAVA